MRITRTILCFLALLAVACGSSPDSVDTQGGGENRGLGDACENSSQCDDGRFCNGKESCEQGKCTAGQEPSCDDNVVCTKDRCDDSQNECVHLAPDEDGDGSRDASCTDLEGMPLGDDCDDQDANRFPGNEEVCDDSSHDEDCDPQTFGSDDPNADQDGDGYSSSACCNFDENGDASCGSDCDDSRAVVHPSNAEACDGLDNDCNGFKDDNLIYCDGVGKRLLSGGISTRANTQDSSGSLRLRNARFESGERLCRDSVCVSGGIVMELEPAHGQP